MTQKSTVTIAAMAVLAAFVLVALMTSGKGGAQTHDDHHHPVDIGRFQYVVVEDGPDWLLDTATGYTWQWQCPPGDEVTSATTGTSSCQTAYKWVFYPNN